MVTGICKWFNSRKGYGFITPDGEETDVFVHHTNLKMEGFRSLWMGDKVEFEIGEGDKGKEAKNVVILERAPRPKRKRRSDKGPSADSGEGGSSEGGSGEGGSDDSE